MNYELSKKLKDAGFPQFIEANDRGVTLKTPRIFSPDMKDSCYVPTLSELIEECNNPVFLSCETVKGRQICVAARELKPNGDWVNSRAGSTPEEAVANLWLALNKKHHEKN